MWPRNCSNYVKTQGLRLGASSTCLRLESVGKCVQCKFTVQFPPRFGLGVRHLSPYDGAEVGIDSELLCGSDVSNEDDVGWSTTGSELKLDIEPKSTQSTQKSDLSGVLLNEPKSVNAALEKYLSDGKTLENSEISHAMSTLLMNRMHSKALQFSERLEAKTLLRFNEKQYASLIDLIAKVHSIEKAESYIESIPVLLRGEIIYRTLLVHYISSGNLKKAEQLFDKMKQSSLATSADTCNQMIVLYKRFNKKKIADILLYMDKIQVEPTFLTYKLLIETKGMTGDIAEMEQILEMMKAAGIVPDLSTKVTMAKHYFAAGFKEKAESVIKGTNCKYTDPVSWAMISAIALFASLGKEDEVEKIWKICEREPQCNGWISVMNAWGKLKRVDKAEAVFDKLAKSRSLSTRDYTAMLWVYAHNKMLNKAEDLMRRMECQIDPSICNVLVKLYVEAGEVEKAVSILEKVVTRECDQVKPLFSSYLCIVEKYGERGDVHNSEMILHRMRQVGYIGPLRPFQALLRAYTKSNSPVYGFTERMKADNLYPTEAMKVQLSRMDPFNKTSFPKIA